jgi:hypothetical protein
LYAFAREVVHDAQYPEAPSVCQRVCSLSKSEYVLSIGLLPNEPATWEFYEYRHLYYSSTVEDAGMDVGAFVLLNPNLSHVARD